jgi:NADH-quinone oxidoreductase subunit E
MHELVSEINKIIDQEASEGGSLITALEEIQERFRYLPPEALILASQKLKVPLSQAYAVATFYQAFNLKPKGKHSLCVCMGTACHVRGSPLILDRIEAQLGIRAGDTTRDRMFSVDTVNCLGACALGPIIVSDGEYSGHMTAPKADKLIQSIKKKDKKDGHG